MQRRGAFTLVEVLIAIGIIVILAGIGFTAMAPARESARQTVCISQLKQIYGGWTLYTDDWPGLTFPNTQMAPVPSSLTLRPYLKDNSIWYCPDYTKDKRRLVSSYLLSFSLDVWTEPLTQGNAIFLDELRKKGDEARAATCLDHDFAYYAPSERQIASPFVDMFVVNLRFNGTVWKGRFGKRFSDFR